jgi:hypothetical protein
MDGVAGEIYECLALWAGKYVNVNGVVMRVFGIVFNLIGDYFGFTIPPFEASKFMASFLTSVGHRNLQKKIFF